jgi:hypothetical protein
MLTKCRNDAARLGGFAMTNKMIENHNSSKKSRVNQGFKANIIRENSIAVHFLLINSFEWDCKELMKTKNFITCAFSLKTSI